MEYESVIGLEIHAELKTKTKMFCFCLNEPDEKHPNINICPVCMAHPGTLPVINQEAVKKTLMVGLALHGEAQKHSQFDRKNYFYPDLPKGYQISQYKHPFVIGGYLEIPNDKIQMSNQVQNPKSKLKKRIRIRRVHLEEDTGRLIHDKKTGATLVDFNRAGVPLLELVTEPDLHSGEEVRTFGEELQKIFRYIGASDADMEKGQMRVEVNMSLRPEEDEKLGTKVEIKNINSFKFAADAIEYEIKRQTGLLERGEKIIQETRGWNEFKKETFLQRTKEEAHDYRYFPEPDLPPLETTPEEVEKIQAELPELPEEKRKRFGEEYGLESGLAEILTRDKDLAGYYESVVSELKQWDADIPRPSVGIPAPTLRRSLGTPAKPKTGNLPKLAASFITGDFLRLLREKMAAIKEILITPENFAELLILVAENKISNLAAKQIMEEMFGTGGDPSEIAEKLGLWQMSNFEDLESIVQHIIKENPQVVESYKKGKTASLQFLIGLTMKESRGKANPKIVREILEKII